MRFLSPFFLCLSVWPAFADTVVARAMIRPNTVVTENHVLLLKTEIDGPYTSLNQIIGYETKVALFKGQPLGPDDLRQPSVVERNQIVRLIYNHGPLRIVTEGRALDRAGIGDLVRVMNLSSHNSITAKVTQTGDLIVE